MNPTKTKKRPTVNVVDQFKHHFFPQSALLIYASSDSNKSQLDQVLVERFDIDDNGQPCNAHPLTESEALELSKRLYPEGHKDRRKYIYPSGLLPDNVLHFNPSPNAESVMWWTKPGRRDLYFTESLKIPNGQAHVPALLWKATRKTLQIFALGAPVKPQLTTPLLRAPFFNVYDSGGMCIGTVKVNMPEEVSLEKFMAVWEHAFFNSYFSHSNTTCTKVPSVPLWKELIATGDPFPIDALMETRKTVQNLLV